MNTYCATDVFTPGSFPSHTYVRVDDSRKESGLKKALETPGWVASLSGPSKSGKSVLVRQVVGAHKVVRVSGAEIKTPDMLWSIVLDRLGLPHAVSHERSRADARGFSAQIHVPLGDQAEASVDLGAQRLQTDKQKVISDFPQHGMQVAVAALKERRHVLLVDDFHYLGRDIQTQVARDIREAASQEVRICVASVPHRSDDVVRSNPELRGRIVAIDSDYWNEEFLKEIGRKGFPLLRVVASEELLGTFAKESLGSPQLMQAICLEACRHTGATQTEINEIELPTTARFLREVFYEVSRTTDFRSALEACHHGELSRGNARKEYAFRDGSNGDSYRAVLLALTAPPPALSIPKAEAFRRMDQVCTDARPTAARITYSCRFMARKLRQMAPDERILEYEDDTLTIVDPYFLFYLKWSGHLSALGDRTPN